MRTVLAGALMALCMIAGACSSMSSIEATWDFSDGQLSSIVDDDFSEVPDVYEDSTVTIIMDADFAVTLTAEEIRPIVTDPETNTDTLRAVRFAEFDLSVDEVIEVVDTWAESLASVLGDRPERRGGKFDDVLDDLVQSSRRVDAERRRRGRRAS